MAIMSDEEIRTKTMPYFMNREKKTVKYTNRKRLAWEEVVILTLASVAISGLIWAFIA